jgi:membrane-associated phospholipid phosphatase
MTVNTNVSSHEQDMRRQKIVYQGLQAPGLLAKQPFIGICLFVFGCLVFAGLTYNLFANGPLLKWDTLIANTLPAIGLQSPAFIKDLMAAGFYLGKEVIFGLDILLTIYFIVKRYWQELAMVTVGWAGSALLFYTLSTFIARPRPLTQIWIVVNIPGFPSGHAISVITFYGLLAYLLVPKMASAMKKTAVIALAVLIIMFVGFSRIFTGGHYLTDILSGYAVGIAWSGLVYTLIEIYFQKRRNLNVKKE